MLRIAALICLVTPLVAQQPWIAQNGVVNSASRIPSALPGGAIARGADFTIFGVRFGDADHTRVAIDAGGVRVDAPILRSTPEQIEARMPDAIRTGAAAVIVSVDRHESARFPITIVPSNPGIFSLNGLGWGPARKEIARPGGRVSLRVNGLAQDGRAIVVIGGVSVTATRMHDELIFTIPSNAPEGCYVPVYIPVSPSRASNVVTIPIAKSGACSTEPAPALDTDTIGVAVIARTSMQQRDGDFISDDASLVFAPKHDAIATSPLLMLPPAGTCSSYAVNAQSDDALPNSISAALASLLGTRGLDAGSQMSLRRGEDSRAIVRVNRVPGYYRGQLGEDGPHRNPRAPALFLAPGDFAISSPGGKQIGAFDAHFSVQEDFEWTGRDALSTIDRARGVTIRWRGAKPDHRIVILASNLDQITAVGAACLCVADAARGEFMIPAAMLGNIPASRDMPGVRYDQLFVTSLPSKPAAFHAAGLANGTVISLYTKGRFVEYR